MLSILLHSCCAPCSAYVIQELQKEYNVTLFYFNPNIFPEEEYLKRLSEAKKYCKKIGVDFIEGRISELNSGYPEFNSEMRPSIKSTPIFLQYFLASDSLFKYSSSGKMLGLK
jgi:predicted adenine nucleotide alpha hydrolase (AANH) superfamily ATPase